uniref:Uncharacterized protein n=1 Tax=Anguilla anguilla TaxID=7936 RepID=A0A0E9S9D4_ANGAN
MHTHTHTHTQRKITCFSAQTRTENEHNSSKILTEFLLQKCTLGQNSSCNPLHLVRTSSCSSAHLRISSACLLTLTSYTP